MTRTIQAHFDGRVIVPDEPVELPPATRLTVAVPIAPNGEMPTQQEIEDRVARIRQLEGAFEGPSLPDEAFDRGSLYGVDNP